MAFRKIDAARFLAAVLAVTMTLGFTGCNNGDDDSSSSSVSSGSDDENKIENHKVGYIFRESASESGFAAQLCEQRDRASTRSSVETCYIENVTLTDFEGAVKALSNDGCTDIVACSPTYANVLNAVAKKYLDLNFISIGALDGGINVSAYCEATYQGAYVAGLVADFNSSAKKIGVVVDPGLTSAVAVVNAVQLGSQLNQDGGSTVYTAAAESDKEIEQAINELRKNGCDVIVCYTNSAHSADYCEKNNIKFIGCLDYSEEENKFSNMIMYFYCRRDSYFLAQFKSMKLGTWATDAYIGDMSNGTVNVSPALKKAANDGTQKLIDAIVPYITGGTAIVFKGPIKDASGNVKLLETDELTDSQILGMNWYVEHVEAVGDFRQAQTEIKPNQFDIKT